MSKTPREVVLQTMYKMDQDCQYISSLSDNELQVIRESLIYTLPDEQDQSLTFKKKSVLDVIIAQLQFRGRIKKYKDVKKSENQRQASAEKKIEQQQKNIIKQNFDRQKETQFSFFDFLRPSSWISTNSKTSKNYHEACSYSQQVQKNQQSKKID